MGENVFKWAFLQRIRHFRGHGVHSPFVYSLVRDVFMKKRLSDGSVEVYEKLLSEGVGKRYAAELQNLHSYCYKQAVIRYAMAGQGVNELERMAAEAEKEGAALVVMSPTKDKWRKQFCSEVAVSGRCLSIYRKGYIAFFFDKKLPRQHYNL